MWQSLTHSSVSVLELCVRAICVYSFVLILLRLGGKRQLAQMSPTEFVAVLLISNAVQNSMNGGDNSLVGGAILAAVLVFMSWIISLLTYKSERWRRGIEGTPTVLVTRGHLVKPNLDRERISTHELRTLLRRQGIEHLSEVRCAILETDGNLDITKFTDEPHSPGDHK